MARRRKKNNNFLNLVGIVIIILILITIFPTNKEKTNKQNKQENKTTITTTTSEKKEEKSSDVLDEKILQTLIAPSEKDFNEKKSYKVINNNEPFFKQEELTTKSFETYSNLDKLGRVGVAYANISLDIMPKEKRREINRVHPTGWVSNKSKHVYDRCHLIGYQLAGENDNEKNLMTGTRTMNVVGMLPFENEVTQYVKRTKNHVLYRVTPIFKDSDLVAQGVLMEAKSVEDNGKGIKFCVFCYNAQKGVKINYKTGDYTLV